MKLIPLSGKNGTGKFAQVDDEDFEYLNQFIWHVHKSKHTFYAVRCKTKKEFKGVKGWNPYKQVAVRMHREVLKITNQKILVDHKDGNGLNNQKSNIRIANYSQNSQNRKPKEGRTSKFMGVDLKKSYYKVKEGKKAYIRWQVQLVPHKGARPITKVFPFTPEGEIEAAKWRDKLAKKYFGKFARLNFLE